MSHVDPFIALSTGGKFYPLGPDPEKVDIRDIAHSLSNQCRYAGHTSAFWSVAAHSVEVSRRYEEGPGRYFKHDKRVGYFSTTDALCALLHDASEAYLQDIVRPIKPLVHGYYQWEENVERAVAQKFGLPFPWSGTIKILDDEIVLDEVACFFPPGSAAWKRYGITAREDHAVLAPLTPEQGEAAFLARFRQLTEGR
ncbi:MAG: phosphohydrolase [Egibacteraceae bacterium]